MADSGKAGKQALVLCAVMLSVVPCALAEKLSDLPSGFYTYMGSEPGRTSPRTFYVKRDKTVVWQGKTPSAGFAPMPHVGTTAPVGAAPESALRPAIPVAAQSPTLISLPASSINPYIPSEPMPHPVVRTTAARQASAQPSSQASSEDSFNFPIYKFKARHIAGYQNGFAQLTTTHNGQDPFGEAKFQLVLLRCPPSTIHLEFLDSNGFKLGEKALTSRDFSPIDGSDLVVAKGDVYLSKKDYVALRDYSVTYKETPTLQFPSYRRSNYRNF